MFDILSAITVFGCFTVEFDPGIMSIIKKLDVTSLKTPVSTHNCVSDEKKGALPKAEKCEENRDYT